jgi:hypothetical protein
MRSFVTLFCSPWKPTSSVRSGAIRGAPRLEHASDAVYFTALAAMGNSWARLRGGKRPGFASSLVLPTSEMTKPVVRRGEDECGGRT